VLGFEAVGFIGWAKKWAETPIRVIMDNLSRVLFPVLARVQHDKEKISRIMEKILYYQTMLLAPAIFGLFMTMPVMVQLIPKYAKWEPALPLFYIFCISAFFSSYSTPFMNLFNALGKVKISFAFMLFWTVTTWLVTPLFTVRFGMLGFPMTQIILATSSLLVMTQAKRIVDFRFVEAVKRPIISTTAMVIGIYIALSFLPVTYVSLVISVVGGAAIYFGVLYFIFSINPVREVRSLFKHE
jgi:O-antigen/teichoic acid export membrane protein